MGKPSRPIVHARAFAAADKKPAAGGPGALAAAAAARRPAATAAAGGGHDGPRKRKAPPPSGERPHAQHPKRAKQYRHEEQHHDDPNQWRASTVIDRQAASFLARLMDAARRRQGGATVKSLCLADGVACKGATYAVTCETLKHLPALRAVVEREGLIERHAPHLGEPLACVLAYEALLGQGLPGGGGGGTSGEAAGAGAGSTTTKQQKRHRSGPAEDAVREALPGLKRAVADLQREAGASSILDLAARLGGGGGGARAGGSAAGSAPDRPPRQQQPHWRSARVNTLKVPSVKHALARLGPDLASKALRDPLLPELLLFPPGTDLHAHEMVARGELVLQGRSSCLPARALLLGGSGGGGGGGGGGGVRGWTCVDACAAPGNKTTHLAALVAGDGAQEEEEDEKKRKKQPASQGRVFAFDRDPRRLELLRASVERAGASRVVACRRADFLQLDPSSSPELRAARAVLLDPSCSGSGTAAARQLASGGLLLAGGGGAAESDGDEQHDQQRVEQLARFQAAALKHALLRFPCAERVAYSTCSVYPRENEAVVAEALADEEVAAAGWQLADPFPAMGGGGGADVGKVPPSGVAPMYGRRGWPHPGLAPGLERRLVRCEAALDGTDGFFVALFVRSSRRGGGVGEKN